MIEMLDLLAQTTTTPTTAPAPSGLEGFLKSPIPMIILVVGVFFWITTRGRKREQKKYQQMLGSLKRNDRVQTIGGIIGTVVDVREDEVVLKVDETSNTKMRFNRQSIKAVIQDAAMESGK